MTSGIGQYHSNEVDPSKPEKTLTPYLTIELSGIRALVDEPQQVDKAKAQWLIPSTLQSRKFNEQEQQGLYWLLWADLDSNPPELLSLADIVEEETSGCDFELYSSRSATKENQKARVLLPLDKPLCFVDWSLAQQTLNDKLEALEVIPDRANERAAQLCYLPNRGALYSHVSKREGKHFDPMSFWTREIGVKSGKLDADALALDAYKSASIAKREALNLSDAPDLIGVFNQAYTPQELLLLAGYSQRGNAFRHPHSESGNYSASVRDGRVNSLSSSDLLYTAGVGAHDAFSTYCILFHGGNHNEALKAAGNEMLAIGGLSYNKAKQIEYGMSKQDTPMANDEIIKRLATLSPIDYDKERATHAKALGIRPATLDGEVKAIRVEKKEAERLPFPNIEPHPSPIDPGQLLNEVSATIRRFIVLDEHQAHAAALWCALTYFIDGLEIAPLAVINAPERACGKTQLLDVIGRMAYRPLPASNATASALFRAVELWKPTLLIDEADTFFRDNTELHGMVNAGYTRSGFVLRSEAVGDSFEPRAFSVYSAKALAGIKLEKHLPDATMSRGIVFNLRRKLSGESVSRLRHAEPELFTGIASKLARFALDYSEQVRRARPVLPDALSDREQDNWDGLLAIASCAGSEWLNKATTSALTLSASASDKTASTGNELLSDIQNIFESKRIDKISTVDLINALCDDEEAPWNTYNRGKPLAPRQLVKQLEPYEIRPRQIRINSYDRMRGFELAQFADAFMRYLSPPPEIICDSVTNGHKPSNGEGSAVTSSVTRHTNICDNLSHVTHDNLSVTPSVTAQATNGAACHTVTDKNAFFGEGVTAQVNTPIFDNEGYF